MNESQIGATARKDMESKDPHIDTLEPLAKAFAAIGRKWPGIVSRDSELPQVASGGSYL